MIYVLVQCCHFTDGYTYEILSASTDLDTLKLWHIKNGDYELSTKEQAEIAYNKSKSYETIEETKEA